MTSYRNSGKVWVSDCLLTDDEFGEMVRQVLAQTPASKV
jgi:hypothetical protein